MTDTTPPPTPTRSDLALEEAVLGVVLKKMRERAKDVQKRYDSVKKELQRELETEEVDKQPVKLPDGTRIGAISKVEEAIGAVVTDEAALRDWVREHSKDNVTSRLVTEIRPAYLSLILKEMTKRGSAQILVPETGELLDVPGIDFQTVRSAYHTYKPAEDAADVIAQAWRDGHLSSFDLPELPTGEDA